MERLKRLGTEGAIASAVDFSMHAEIQSGPFALLTSKDLQTSSCVHSTSGEQSGCGGIIEIGSVDELK